MYVKGVEEAPERFVIKMFEVSDGRNLKHLVDLLLFFFMERSCPPDEENANYGTDLKYLFNMFAVWNYMFFVEKSDAYYPFLKIYDFESALRWCFRVYHVPGEICTKENGDKYVRGIILTCDVAILYSMVVESSINHRLEQLRENIFISDDIEEEIDRLEDVKEEVKKLLSQASDLEEYDES